VVLADGKTAARGVSDSVDDQIASRVRTAWIEGDLRESLIEFIATATSGVTVAAGEPSVPAGPGGRGGRNTHAALAAATMIDGTGMTFASFATDGVDGRSGAAGAIVDGTTVSRGGDPTSALAQFDSATYLEATGDLIEIGPTGTNVADLWLIWKPEDGSEPILSV
jgi:hydroxypyruvate reductase